MPNVNFRKTVPAVICLIFTLSIFADAQSGIKKHIKGSFVNGVYTSPEKDFQVHAPELSFNASVYDELVARAGGIRNMAFSDILGSQYSVLSFPASLELTLDEALLSSGIVYDKQFTQTARGPEWQMLSVLPNGSNIEEIANGIDKQLDLISACSIFAANSRTYRICAGIPNMAGRNFEMNAERARLNLGNFLAGFRTNNVPSNEKEPDITLTKKIQGTFSNNIYTSPLKYYRVRAPKPFRPGMNVRDENERTGTEVIFSDDMGGFYRVITLNIATLEESLGALKEPIQKQEIQTARGKEFRVLNVERAGAEVSLRVPGAAKDSNAGIPDLVTANAAFIVNGLVYHVVAGVINFDNANTQTTGEIARKRLEKFLAGFEVLPSAR